MSTSTNSQCFGAIGPFPEAAFLPSCLTLMPAVSASQIADSDLIGASAGAMAALLRARPNGATWKDIAELILNLFSTVIILLEAAPSLPGFDAAVVDAGWERCGKVRLPQNIAKVRAPIRNS